MPFLVRASDLGKAAAFSCPDRASAVKRARLLLKQNRTGVSIDDGAGNCLEGAALQAVVFPEVRGRAELMLTRLSFAWIEPLQFAWKKRARMAAFDIASLDVLPPADIDLQPAAAGCTTACSEIVEAHRQYLAKYLSTEAGRTAPRRWCKGIPLLLDLENYPDFHSYAAAVNRRSKGAAPREAHRARGLGFYCKPFDRQHHRLDLFEIETSKRFRSAGPVLAAFLRRPPRQAERPATAPASPAPFCDRHWYRDWGVFIAEPGGGERLVGYAYLKRVGSIVRTTAFLGHGAYLSQGVMKLLFVEVMRWLLDRADPLVSGIRYLHYGAVEQGGLGLVAWKRRLQFEPAVLRWP